MISVEMNILSSVPRELDSSVPLIPYFEKKYEAGFCTFSVKGDCNSQYSTTSFRSAITDQYKYNSKVLITHKLLIHCTSHSPGLAYA
jgi:hypothetical protein